jgi:hypothetical protein
MATGPSTKQALSRPSGAMGQPVGHVSVACGY